MSDGALIKIQEFQYLKDYLPGQAEKCKMFSNDNYREALNLLKERSGNT